MKPLARLPASAGILLSFSAAVGLTLGVRAVVALELPGWGALPGLRSLLSVTTLPREPMALAWTSRVVWPGDLQAMAVDRIASIVAALLLAAASVALLNALVLLAEAGASRRKEMAVRAAIGAAPRSLVALLFRQVRALILTGLAFGILLGFTSGAALRAAWPGTLGGLGVGGVATTVLVVLSALAGLGIFTYVRVGLRVGRAKALAAALGSGDRTTADHREAFLRRILSAVQMGAAGAVALGTVALALAVARPVAVGDSTGDTVAVAVTAPARDARGDAASAGNAWAALLARLDRIPGMEAESLATPGALIGLGVRDNATAQCGDCYAGVMPMPFWGVRADHHAVAPGYFEAAGMRVSEGRPITAEDVASSRKVAVVNRTFANTAFEDGLPLGHQVKLGRALDGWYDVVGVVEDHATPAIGGDDLARSAVYVSAFQQAPGNADMLLRGSDDAVNTAVALLAAAGYQPSEPRTVAIERGRAAAPLAWTARVAVLLGLLTMVVAMHGSHATALQVTRRRTRELAIRRVLGATDRRVVGYVLAGSIRTALWGAAVAAFFGALLIGLLRKTAGGVPSPGPAVYLGVTALLVGSALLASVRATREALAVEPGAAMK